MSSVAPAAPRTPRLAVCAPNSPGNYAGTSFLLRVDRGSCSPGAATKSVDCLSLEPANVAPQPPRPNCGLSAFSEPPPGGDALEGRDTHPGLLCCRVQR